MEGDKNPKKNTKALDPRILKVADRIKELRQKKGFTSSENFANQYDLSRVHYWRIERGSNFTLESLLKILDIHKISLKQFFDDIE